MKHFGYLWLTLKFRKTENHIFVFAEYTLGSCDDHCVTVLSCVIK